MLFTTKEVSYCLPLLFQNSAATASPFAMVMLVAGRAYLGGRRGGGGGGIDEVRFSSGDVSSSDLQRNS